VACVLSSAAVLLAAAPAGAEAPLGDLVRFPPDVQERRREPFGIEDFLQQVAGVDPDSIESQITAVGSPSTSRVTRIVRGVRFHSADDAEAAAVALANDEHGQLLDLGSLGAGFVVSVPPDPDPSLPAGAPRLYVHDGFRVAGRDLFSFVETSLDPAAPQELIDHITWHAETYPGSSTSVSGDRRSGTGTIAVVLGGLVVVTAAGVGSLVRRRRTPAPTAPSGPVHRPWVA
jgi:hypothetical protein